MQTAKKLVLVDEFDREYKRLQRPAEAVAKTDHSLQLSDTLRDQSVADNQKVREYIAALHRYLNVRKEVPAQLEVEPNFGVVPPTGRGQPATGRGQRRRRKHQPWTPY